MKKFILLVMTSTLVACASSQTVLQAPPAPSQSSNPIRPVQVDCNFGLSMMYQLENIVANPYRADSFWDPMFAQIAGTQTPAQRSASAKYVLWSIRTKCQGY